MQQTSIDRTALRPADGGHVVRNAARVLLGGALIFAGTSHLTFARKPFQAQVPESIPANTPFDTDSVVLGSGVVEILLGTTLALAPKRRRRLIGDVAATFFAAVFPGNIAQLLNRKDAFGLDTDGKRAARLLGQPLLVGWALWSTRD